jgi:hypothetical protein
MKLISHVPRPDWRETLMNQYADDLAELIAELDLRDLAPAGRPLDQRG